MIEIIQNIKNLLGIKDTKIEILERLNLLEENIKKEEEIKNKLIERISNIEKDQVKCNEQITYLLNEIEKIIEFNKKQKQDYIKQNNKYLLLVEKIENTLVLKKD